MFSIVLINPLSILISLSTMFGVVVHDTKIDQLTVSAFAMPAIIASYESANGALKLNDPHTHTERVSLSEMVRNLNSEAPRTQPRTTEDKRHLVQKNAARGRHPFDSYFLPVLS